MCAAATAEAQDHPHGPRSPPHLPLLQVMTYFDQGPEGRAAIGIGDSLVRYSCGVEDADDIWEDLAQALAQI